MDSFIYDDVTFLNFSIDPEDESVNKIAFKLKNIIGRYRYEMNQNQFKLVNIIKEETGTEEEESSLVIIGYGTKLHPDLIRKIILYE